MNINIELSHMQILEISMANSFRQLLQLKCWAEKAFISSLITSVSLKSGQCVEMYLHLIIQLLYGSDFPITQISDNVTF